MHDPKSLAFTQTFSKVETIFKNYGRKDDGGGNEGGRIKKGKKYEGDKKCKWKLTGSKKG